VQVKSDSKDLIRKLKIFGGIVVTAAAVYFCMLALNGLNPDDIFKTSINWLLAGLSAAIFAFATFLRALVYPFGIDREMTILEAWQVVAIGNMANMLLPFRAGEGVRLAVFPKRYNAARRAKLALIPGMADIAVILLLSIAAVYIADFKSPVYVMILKIASFGFLAFCALTIIILLIIPKTRSEVLSYINFDTLDMVKWVALSWITMLFSIWVGFLSFGYGPLRSIILTFGAFAGMNIACLIPSSPGNIGIFEYSVIVGLAGLGISQIPAKTAGLLLHAIQYVALLPLGGVLYVFFVMHRHRQNKFLFANRSYRG
jgi:hypothetical protein